MFFIFVFNLLLAKLCTGRQATANVKESLEWGTKIVGGVKPGVEGEHLGLPIFPSVKAVCWSIGRIGNSAVLMRCESRLKEKQGPMRLPSTFQETKLHKPLKKPSKLRFR